MYIFPGLYCYLINIVIIKILSLGLYDKTTQCTFNRLVWGFFWGGGALQISFNFLTILG